MDEIQVVVFTLGDELFAIPIGNVKEIINATKLPRFPKLNAMFKVLLI